MRHPATTVPTRPGAHGRALSPTVPDQSCEVARDRSSRSAINQKSMSLPWPRCSRDRKYARSRISSSVTGRAAGGAEAARGAAAATFRRAGALAATGATGRVAAGVVAGAGGAGAGTAGLTFAACGEAAVARRGRAAFTGAASAGCTGAALEAEVREVFFEATSNVLWSRYGRRFRCRENSYYPSFDDDGVTSVSQGVSWGRPASGRSPATRSARPRR